MLPSRAAIKLQESTFWWPFGAPQKYGFRAIVHFGVRGCITNDCLESSQLQYPQMRFRAHFLVQGISTQPFSHRALVQIHSRLMMVQSCCHLLSSLATSWPSSTDCVWSVGCVHLCVLPLQPHKWAQALADNLIRDIASCVSLWDVPAALCSLDKFRVVKFLKPDRSRKRNKT